MATYRACLRCGGLDLRMPSVGAGDAFIPGVEDVMGTTVCGTCGFKAIPLTFDSEADWKAYREEREREGWKDWKVQGEGMTALPTTEAPASGLFVPGVLLAGGVFLSGVGFLGLLALTRGNPFAVQAIAPFLIGIALAAIGAKLWGQARKSGKTPE